MPAGAAPSGGADGAVLLGTLRAFFAPPHRTPAPASPDPVSHYPMLDPERDGVAFGQYPDKDAQRRAAEKAARRQSAVAAAARRATGFAPGDRVRCRMRAGDEWREGTVAAIDGKNVKVRADEMKHALFWPEVERAVQGN